MSNFDRGSVTMPLFDNKNRQFVFQYIQLNEWNNPENIMNILNFRNLKDVFNKFF